MYVWRGNDNIEGDDIEDNNIELFNTLIAFDFLRLILDFLSLKILDNKFSNVVCVSDINLPRYLLIDIRLLLRYLLNNLQLSDDVLKDIRI